MFSYYDAEKIGEIAIDKESGLEGIGVATKNDDQPHYYWFDPEHPKIILFPKQWPAMNKDRLDFNLIDAKRNFDTGFLSLDFIIDNKFFYLRNLGHDLYEKDPYPLNENIDVYINDELSDTIDFSSETYEDDMVYHLDIQEDVSLRNINIRFVSNDKKGELEQLVETVNLNTSNEIEYTINFDDSETERIVSPIGIFNDKVTFETLSFTKAFSDLYEYPQTTNNIIYLDYKDDLNNYKWTPKRHIDASINLKGYQSNQRINLKLDNIDKNNKYIYKTDDKFYFNQEKEKIYSGESDEYLNEKGIVIPWDFENNKGTLLFDLNIKTYQKYNIHFKLKIGNKFPLRGDNGRFLFEEERNE